VSGESDPAIIDYSIPSSAHISVKYFSDFFISYRRGSLKMARVSGLKATKGVLKAG
jgi:hypothetical protein